MTDELTTAQQEQVLSLEPVVVGLARRLTNEADGPRFDDAASDGWLGAIQAVQRFDPNQNPSLSGYATRRIWGAMVDGLRRRSKYSRSAKEARGDFQADDVWWDSQESRGPTPVEVAEFVDWAQWVLGMMPPRVADILIGSLEGRSLVESVTRLGLCGTSASYYRRLAQGVFQRRVSHDA